MDYETDYWTLKAMQESPKAFVRLIAVALESADRTDFAKGKQLFMEYFDQYFDQGQTLRFAACPEGVCDGSREIPTDASDGEGHTMRGAGTLSCPHHD